MRESLLILAKNHDQRTGPRRVPRLAGVESPPLRVNISKEPRSTNRAPSSNPPWGLELGADYGVVCHNVFRIKGDNQIKAVGGGRGKSLASAKE